MFTVVMEFFSMGILLNATQGGYPEKQQNRSLVMGLKNYGTHHQRDSLT